jgi:hypothetical protein
MRKLRQFSLFVLGCCTFLFASCVSNPPISDYSIARAAYDSAKESGAPRLAPAQWFKADQSYKKAQKLFKDRDYSGAREAFEESRFLSEKAENTARITSPDGGGLQ